MVWETNLRNIVVSEFVTLDGGFGRTWEVVLSVLE